MDTDRPSHAYGAPLCPRGRRPGHRHRYPRGNCAAAKRALRSIGGRGHRIDPREPHPAPIGELPRAWRQRRSLSQLELALAAGYALQYIERSLEEPEMAPIHQALDRFLRAHEPYPAVILDRHYNNVSANDATAVLTEGIAPELRAPPANALRTTLHPDPLPAVIGSR